MANDLLRGRQTVAALTNKSGGPVAAGDVVILDSANASSFTTTTTAALATRFVGVALETIASNASGRVCLFGYVPAIALSSSASLGQYVATHTVAKQAAPTSSQGAGVFGQVLGTGTTPAALLFGYPQQASGGGGGGPIGRGVDASRPAAGNAGALYLPTDGLGAIYEDNGATWQPFGPVWPLTAPDDAVFSWVNQDSATVAVQHSGIHLGNATDNGGSDSLNLRVKSAPATPYTITALLLSGQAFGGTFDFGLCFRESGTGKLHVWHVYNTSGGPNVESGKYTSPTAISSTYFFGSGPFLGMLSPIWMRIADNGTSRICSLSGDGQNFYTAHTVGRTDFMTGGADQVGFFVAPTSGIGGVTLLSWKEA